MIPPFNKNEVLPPYLNSDPCVPINQSPYQSDIIELCHRFATSRARVEILKGLVQFRLDCIKFGIVDGFQWLDGSFMENIEVSGLRDPNDIDVISFVFKIDPAREGFIATSFVPFFDRNKSKLIYKVDHFPVLADRNPVLTLRSVQYWIQLFSHNRKGIWKGMIEIPLNNNKVQDEDAMNYLNSLKP